MENLKEKYIGIDSLRLKQLGIKFVTSLAIFGLTSYLTPNFQIHSFPILILSAICIVVLDYMMSVISGIHDLPYGRAIVGFVSASIIIFLTQFIVAGYYITLLSSIIAALIYATMSYFIPNEP